MDFFEAQARARNRTNRLVLLFVAAVLGTIGAGYLAALFIHGSMVRQEASFGATSPWLYWNADLFIPVALITVAVVGVASLIKWTQMRAGGAAIAASVGGRAINPQTTDLHERRLLNIVEEMAIASGVPIPAVFVLEGEQSINAFAAGLKTTDAAVAVTRGTMEKLSRDELQAVVAHEFSHILNGDMRLNVKLSAIVFGILVIGIMGRGLLYSLGRGRVRGGGGKDKGGGIAFLLAIGIALMIVGYIGYFFGRLIQAAVSRQREFLADASAVQFTRNPAGISGALKKIGGYALGSQMTHANSAEIGHFFFAQGFRSNFGGLWATHPPLADRVLAVEPRWDGKFFEPPAVVDVARESFASAKIGGTPPLHREVLPSARIPFVPMAVIAEIGALTEAHFQRAQTALAAIPESLRTAAHDPLRAAALVYALLLDATEPTQAKQCGLITHHAGDATAETTRALHPATLTVEPSGRLPLLQLCLPTLRTLSREALAQFVTTLDELIHADGQVSPFEFALQKMLVHQLEALRTPSAAVAFHSFKAVEKDIAVVLSALAYLGSGDDRDAVRRAFGMGAHQVKLLDELALLPRPACGLTQLDAALTRLAQSSLPIKQRVLAAAAHAIGADGTVTIEEGELYRAIAASLDCPAPALAGA